MKSSSILILVLIFSNLVVFSFSSSEISNLHTVINFLSENRKLQPAYWPIPKEIKAGPSYYYSPENERLSIKYGDPLREAYGLLLVNDGGQYVWKSNNDKKLATIIEWHKQPLSLSALLEPYEEFHDLTFIPEKVQNQAVFGQSSSGKITVFEALDHSGLIVIKHDHHLRNACSDNGNDDSAYYWEIRFDSQEIFSGGIGYFPPKPEGWCQPIGNKEALVLRYLKPEEY